MRKRLSNEDIFLKAVKSLIKNLLIDNPNYKSDYYYKPNGSGMIPCLVDDTKERGNHILKEINDMEHLLLDEDDDFEVVNYSEERSICEYLGLRVDRGDQVLAWCGDAGWQIVCHLSKLKMYLKRKISIEHDNYTNR